MFDSFTTTGVIKVPHYIDRNVFSFLTPSGQYLFAITYVTDIPGISYFFN